MNDLEALFFYKEEQEALEEALERLEDVKSEYISHEDIKTEIAI